MKVVNGLMAERAVGNFAGANFRGYRGSSVVQMGRRQTGKTLRHISKWNPYALAGKVCWYCFGEDVVIRELAGLKYVVEVRNRVSGGNSLLQVDPSRQPAWELFGNFGNGIRCARGDASNDILSCLPSSWAADQPFSVCMVADEPATVSAARRMLQLDIVGSSRLTVQPAVGLQFVMAAPTVYVCAGRVDVLPKRWRALYNGAASRMFFNEAGQKPIGNAGGNRTSTLSVFGQSDLTLFTSFRIWELIIVQGLMSVADINLLDVYFRDKYW